MLAAALLSTTLSLAGAAESSSDEREPARVWPGPRSGRGLVIAAAATGGISWGLALGTINVARKECPPPDGCVGPLVGLSIGRSLANGTTLALAIPAGVLAGRYDASHRDFADPERRQRAFVAAGASTLAVGTAGWIATWVVRLTVPPPEDPRAFMVGHHLRLQFSAALATTGAGLLSYGLAFRRRRRGVTQASLGPQLLPAGGGLTLTGRF